MKKIWEWLKVNWKWLVLPLWIASVVLVWIFRGGTKPMFPPSGTTDVAADQALKAKDEAIESFKARLDELHKKAEERLKTASEAQVKEFKELKDKPIEDVAKWIDSLS